MGCFCTKMHQGICIQAGPIRRPEAKRDQGGSLHSSCAIHLRVHVTLIALARFLVDSCLDGNLSLITNTFRSRLWTAIDTNTLMSFEANGHHDNLSAANVEIAYSLLEFVKRGANSLGTRS